MLLKNVREEQERSRKRQQSMKQAHLRREALRQKQQAEREKLSQQHLITSTQELNDVIGAIDAENISAFKKRWMLLKLRYRYGKK